MQTNKTALVVSDDPSFRHRFVGIGERLGLQVSFASSAADARRQLSRRFELVFLDKRLPDARSVTLLDELRSGEDEVPVIVVGASLGARRDVPAGRHGIHEFCRDPFGIHEARGAALALVREDDKTAPGTVIDLVRD